MNNESKEDLKPVAYLKPFKRFCMSIGELPSAYVETMTYYEMLIWFIEYMKNTIIPTINNNGEAVNELQDKFVEFANTLSQEQTDFENAITEQQNTFETNITNQQNTFETNITTQQNNYEEYITGLFNTLQTFVNDYFDNLDVQEEINNKLDDMVEDGTLQEIITQYLQSAVTWTFDTINTMKQAPNLINGSYAKTLGYHTINDGGEAQYFIRNKLNTDVEDNGIIHFIGNDLVAELIINEKLINVKQFGAYGDNDHDDTSYFNNMISKLNKIKTDNSTYKIESSINIPSNCEIDINGTINYTGTDYGFIITSLSYKNIKIDSFTSSTGGMFKLEPTVNKFISFVNIYVKYAHCQKECVYANATNGTITTITLDGIRWHSSTIGVVNMYIANVHESNIFLTEINVKNMDLWTNSPVFGIVATNEASNVEIQFNLHNVDLENCSGISTTGRITTMGLFDCRFNEITHKNGWLTIDGYLPQIVINGLGYIYPEKIILNNITQHKLFIETNLTIIDYITSYNYEGGGVLGTDYFIPNVKKQVWKNISSEIVNNAYTLEFSKNGGIYNWLSIDTNDWLTLTIPKNAALLPILFIENRTAGHSLTITNGTGTTIIASPEQATYVFYMVGNAIKYLKLN